VLGIALGRLGAAPGKALERRQGEPLGPAVGVELGWC
jgi:hypothetical protein